MSPVKVALRSCSCWRWTRDILAARLRLRLRLRLQAIAKDVVRGCRVIEAGLQRAQLGGGRRQRLDVEIGRGGRAARPHISLRTLEVAIVARLRIHWPRWWKRSSAASRRCRLAFGGAPAPGSSVSNWNKSCMRFKARAFAVFACGGRRSRV
jgi:hypothetical protein